MDDLFRKTVAEVVLRHRAEIRERENHDGWFRDRSRSWLRKLLLYRSFTKMRRITSLDQIDNQGVCDAFGRVVFPKLCSQTGSVYSDDGSNSRIKFAMAGIELNSNNHLF